MTSEREILSKILTHAMLKNWSVEMLCGEEGDILLERVDLSKEAHIDNLLDQCCQVDYEQYRFYNEDKKRIGSIWLTWGEGEDLIQDCNVGEMEKFLEEIGL